MRTTGRFDFNDKEIFEGDIVMMAWGFGMFQGKEIVNYMLHKITFQPAHKMANGEMHDDGDGFIFCLGKCYNFWKGPNVRKLDPDTIKELAEADITEDNKFYFDPVTKQPKRYTD